ncbi:hypothetical protein M407DRAFT_29410 [Tulasnella calospora MUT 4182]|uniref:Uncharacterized protein n=1 Tax=Tulasnella calospora MUT 4182 TaxID=1051891 RepID=A0A0C3KHL6_9AGAM|nr:hypothetical protein M407DRAFT_29410 [Tulasnella calospora MUT 4182]
MKLSTLYISSLTLLPSVITAAAITGGVPLNGTLARRGGEVNYLADCSRWVPSTSEQYPASYMAWYSNVDNSLDQQKPDSLSNEYRDWSAGGTWLTWEGQQHNIHFADSGVTVQTHIDSDASSRDFMAWAGWIQRTSDWRVFNCYKNTNWPSQSKEVANNLLQTINDLPDIPLDASVTIFKDTLVEFIRRPREVKEASEKYGRKDLGLLGGIKDKLRSRRRGGCTATLQACRDDIESASANLRGSGTPSELQPQPNTPLFRVDYPPEPFEPSRTLQTTPAERTVGSEHGTSHPTFLPDSSPNPPKKEESRCKIRDGALIAARGTFKAVEAMSGAIPVFGGFVGIAAKIGSAFVNMIEIMDKNEDV